MPPMTKSERMSPAATSFAAKDERSPLSKTVPRSVLRRSRPGPPDHGDDCYQAHDVERGEERPEEGSLAEGDGAPRADREHRRWRSDVESPRRRGPTAAAAGPAGRGGAGSGGRSPRGAGDARGGRGSRRPWAGARGAARRAGGAGAARYA